MGRKSTRDNKSIYQLKREELNLTREEASELLDGLSDDRIEKIETGKSEPHPDEVLLFAKAYNAAEIALNYCSHDCPIGQKYVPEIKPGELAGTVLEILDSINSLNGYKDELIKITADGIITDEERPELDEICNQLSRISAASSALKVWMENKLS